MSFTADRTSFVGFWPWPRVWLSATALSLAEGLKRSSSGIHLAEPLLESQASVFRQVVLSFAGTDFEAHLCADGLFAYRSISHEAAIASNWELAKDDITVSMSASGEAWTHYVSALNILFMLVESELHRGGRNTYVYWVPVVTRTDIVRVRYDGSGDALSTTWHGPETEMGMQRYTGQTAVGSRIDGQFHAEVLDAFDAAMATFEQAHCNSALWSYLSAYAEGWATFHNGLKNGALIQLWSLIERRLLEITSDLLATVPVGSLMRTTKTGVSAMSTKDETRLRGDIAAGKSPMAGIMISVLDAHGMPTWTKLSSVKGARDRLAHGGDGPGIPEVIAALEIGRSICMEKFDVEIAAKLTGNPHFGLTP